MVPVTGLGGGDVTVVVGGDTAPADAALKTLKERGYEYPYSATLGLVKNADVSLVNLEAAVTKDAERFPLYKRYLYRVEPRALKAMRWAGIRGVSLANNHVMDFGRQGLLDTLEQLRSAGITPVGAGNSSREARRGAVFDVRGTRIGVLSYMQNSVVRSVYMQSFARSMAPGVARLTLANLRLDLQRMRRNADLVVVLVHWGNTYSDVTLRQKFYGRMMVRFGADAVFGHHPHVMQPMEVYRGRPIFYSLGNYAFGTPGRSWFRHGLLVRMRLQERALQQLEIFPLLVQNRMVHFKPERLYGADARAALAKLAARSAPLGAKLEIKESRAVWRPGGGKSRQR